MHRAPHLRFRLLALLSLVAALTSFGCVTAYLNPGPNPARIEVDLAAQINPDRWRTSYWRPDAIYWDWGLYLVGADGSLAPLGPVSGERLKVIQCNPLQRKTVFTAPPGARRIRILAEAYAFRQSGMSEDSYGLQSFKRDFDLNLKAGAAQALKVRFGQGRRARETE